MNPNNFEKKKTYRDYTWSNERLLAQLFLEIMKCTLEGNNQDS